MILPTLFLRVPEHVHWRRFADEIVVLDLKGGYYHGLNDVAAAAFERIAAGRRLGQVVDELLDIYSVDRQQLQDDISTLIQFLVDRSLLVADQDD
jgi:hypothetical protein